MQLTDLFDLSLVGRRDSPALEWEEADGSIATFTWGAIDARADRVAHALRGRGLAAGDRLGLYLANRVEYVDLVLAALSLGVILVPINILYREREIAHIVGDARPTLVAADAAAAPLFPAGTPIWDVADIASVAAATAGVPRVRTALDGDAPALIVYTSGTTGRAKGAVLSHNNCLANTANLVTCWRMTGEDRYLGVLPLFHVHGLANGLFVWLATGSSMRLAARFDAACIADQLDGFGATVLFGVPTMYVRLLEVEPAVARRIGERARLFVCGSAPLPAAVLEAFRERYGHTILERYGMSETLMNLGNPYAGVRKPGSVGLPFPGVSARVVHASGVAVAEGETGELLVRGPNVCAGYWERPDATAAAFVDGWFRTGDLARRDADGYYTLCGRRSDLIISGGFNIYPREIEEVLLEQPGVREAVVVGVPDARRGEVPVAYLVSAAEVDDAALEAVCRRQLASFKIPRGFVRVESLPRTALGKVQKHLLPPYPVA